MDFDGKPVVIGPTVDVYADEQGSPVHSSPQVFAVGMVYATDDIPMEPLREALDARRRRNCRCIKRDTFRDRSPAGRGLAPDITCSMPGACSFVTARSWTSIAPEPAWRPQ